MGNDTLAKSKMKVFRFLTVVFALIISSSLIVANPAAAKPQTKGGVSGPSQVEVGKPATYRIFFKLKPGTRNATLRVFWGDGVVETRKVKVSCASGRCVTKPVRFVRWHRYEVPGDFTIRARILEKKNVVGKNTYNKKIVVSSPAAEPDPVMPENPSPENQPEQSPPTNNS